MDNLFPVAVTSLTFMVVGGCFVIGFFFGYSFGKKVGFTKAKDALLSTKNSEVWEVAHFLHVEQENKELEQKRRQGATTAIQRSLPAK